jgi:hypothetical protein
MAGVGYSRGAKGSVSVTWGDVGLCDTVENET